MFDSTITVRAESVEKAIQQGLKQLNITEDLADIRVISEGKKGFLGFGKQEAVVSVSVKDNASARESLASITGVDSAPKKAKADKTAAYIKSYNSSDVEESKHEYEEEVIDRLSQREQELEAQALRQKEEKMMAEEPVVADTRSVVEDTMPEEEATEEDLFEEEVENSPAPVQPQEANTESVDREQIAESVCRYLEKVIQGYGFEVDVEVNYEIKSNQFIFNIDTDKSGLVIGKHGKIINALQTLVQVLIHQHNLRRTSVLLNVGDYRNRRASVLEQMAERTAEQVLRTKQTVILDPLPAYERKQIHAHLSKIDHISTHSEGKDPNRYLVVDYLP